MLADGTKPEQVTNNEFVNVHPHVSPDGTQVAFLSFAKAVSGADGDKDCKIRTMLLSDHTIRIVSNLSEEKEPSIPTRGPRTASLFPTSATN